MKLSLTRLGGGMSLTRLGGGMSLTRLGGVMIKEFIQMKRDRMTFGMIVGIPVIQLIMFGFAINSDPKHLPIAVVSADNSVYSRSLIRAMENTNYFTLVKIADSEIEANRLLDTGDVQFVVTIPVDFAKKLVRGERPALLVEADATDPSATGPRLQHCRRCPGWHCSAIWSAPCRQSRRALTRWISSFTAATTPKACRATTLCPVSSAPSSP
jgi:hypothetical protein